MQLYDNRMEVSSQIFIKAFLDRIYCLGYSIQAITIHVNALKKKKKRLPQSHRKPQNIVHHKTRSDVTNMAHHRNINIMEYRPG